MPQDQGYVQERLRLRPLIGDGAGGYEVCELSPAAPWKKGPPQQPSALRAGEVTVTYLGHACVDIKLGDAHLVTDPWLHGPAWIHRSGAAARQRGTTLPVSPACCAST